MKNFLLKILFLSGTIGGLLLSAGCEVSKRVPENKVLLRNYTAYINGVPTDDSKVNNFVLQKPNSYVLGMPLSLYIYNWGNPDAEKDFDLWLEKHPRWHRFLNGLLSEKQVGRLQKSFFVSGIDRQLMRIGEAPSVLDNAMGRKSTKQLGAYFKSIGYFNAKVKDSIFLKQNQHDKYALVGYYINTGDRYLIDSLKTSISSPQIDSVYQKYISKRILKTGNAYQLADFSAEKARLYELFRNNGFYTFQQSSIGFEVLRDTVGTSKDRKLQVTTIIGDLIERDGDVITQKKYKVHRLNKIRVYTDYETGSDKAAMDSLAYKNIVIYYKDKLRYRPKVLAHALDFKYGQVYSDLRRGNTYKQLNNLRVFRYPNIDFKYATVDTLENKLDANVYLSALDKFSLRVNNEIKRSEIEAIGIGLGTSFSARNIKIL